MTVGQLSGSQTQVGYGNNYLDSSLSSEFFGFNNTLYLVNRIRLFPIVGTNQNAEIKLSFDFFGRMTVANIDRLTLKVGEVLTGTTSWRFVDRASSSVVGPDRSPQLEFIDTGLTWSKGDRVRVALSAANQGAAGTAVLRGEAKVGRILTVDPVGDNGPQRHSR